MGGGEEHKCTPTSAGSFIAGVIMGTVNTLVMKTMFDVKSVDVNGEETKFEKPIFLAVVMFASMTLSLPAHKIYQHFYTPKEEREEISYHLLGVLIIPAAFDLVATIVSQVGLLYVTPSLFMLIRCAVIIITAILKVTVLHHPLARHMWLGVGINFVAMCIVAAPSFVDPISTGGDRDPRWGILFILISCVIQSSQYVFEEKVMAVDNVPPLIVVGMEGFWGLVLSLVVVWPLAYVIPGEDKGSLENLTDAFIMAYNNSTLVALTLVFFCSVALYNVFAVFITHLLSSVWHAILDNFRPVAVWGTDLILYYCISNGKFGEKWIGWASWLQLVGMFALFFGTAVYNGSVPHLFWHEKPLLGGDEEEEPRKFFKIRTPAGMATPTLTRSPLLGRKPRPDNVEKSSTQYGALHMA